MLPDNCMSLCPHVVTSEFRIPGQHLQQLLAELNGRSHIRRLSHRGARVPSYVSSGVPEAMGMGQFQRWFLGSLKLQC